MNRAIVQAKTCMDQLSTSTIDPFEELTNEWKVWFLQGASKTVEIVYH